MTLAEELATDPLGRGYAGMTDEDCAASLNVVDRPAPVPAKDVLRYLALVDAWADIADAARDAALNGAKRKAARRVVDALAMFDDFDMEDPQVASVVTTALDGCVSEGLLTDPQKSTILALGANRQSRAQEQGLGRVYAGTVAQARAA